jgi:hypothetical protein
MARRILVCLTVLLGAGCLAGFAAAADGGKPGKLINVTLDSEDEFGVVPLHSLGADVVNLAGRSEAGQQGTKRMTLECLPGATVWLIAKEANQDNLPILTLLPDDDGKTLHLKFAKYIAYKNGVPFSVDLAKAGSAGEAAKRWKAAKQAMEGKSREGLTLMVDFDDGSLSVLQELKGSGVGLFFPDSPDVNKFPKEAAAKLQDAIGDVEPKRMTLTEGGFAVLGGSLAKVESLYLKMEHGGAIPDLSKLTSLRCFLLANEGGSLDLKPLAKLTQLRALTVVGNECSNAGAIGSLKNLEFLAMVFKSPGEAAILRGLHNLRYLASEFPADADYSFAEKMPGLQTLCILNVSEKHNLKSLAKLRQLRCLALSRNRERDESKTFVAAGYENVKEFQKGRPDVEVVEYRGICLGSAWMVVLAAVAAVAAIAAWLIRRRRIGSSAS